MSILPQVINYARSQHKNVHPCHDFTHTERVVKLALQLALLEHADREIVEISAWLHDIGRDEEDECHSQGKEQLMNHAIIGAEKAKTFLDSLHYSPSKIEAIVHAIATHRYRKSDPTSVPATIEAKILYDADKLDSIGAIGVARAYAYAGENGYRLFTHTPAFYSVTTKDPSLHSPVIEYEVKLRYVKDSLFTANAKRIGEKRHAFMTKYYQELENDVNPQF